MWGLTMRSCQDEDLLAARTLSVSHTHRESVANQEMDQRVELFGGRSAETVVHCVGSGSVCLSR